LFGAGTQGAAGSTLRSRLRACGLRP
jgi:hypothetical protein